MIYEQDIFNGNFKQGSKDLFYVSWYFGTCFACLCMNIFLYMRYLELSKNLVSLYAFLSPYLYPCHGNMELFAQTTEFLKGYLSIARVVLIICQSTEAN